MEVDVGIGAAEEDDVGVDVEFEMGAAGDRDDVEGDEGRDEEALSSMLLLLILLVRNGVGFDWLRLLLEADEDRGESRASRAESMARSCLMKSLSSDPQSIEIWSVR